ncbi:MAG: glycyl-radical enzyme activating protein [Anaerovoracaceae bacterium]|nr:glycyl-radical enzyme activating protein [Anaerovoracaceae bacterium]
MQLQNFSVNDGEGIRTNIFLAGCPLRCAWCANPEGQTPENPMTRYAETDEIVREIDRQYVFYRFSGGGVTFSGGEPTSQPEFLAELTDVLYDKGYSLAIETCGFFDFGKLRPVLEKMDLIFMDLKHPDTEKHRQFTGVGNELIIENIEKASMLGPEFVVRIPTIEGVNADEQTMRRAFEIIKEKAPSASLELLPYHSFGDAKYEQLGMDLPDRSFARPSDETMKTYESIAASCGINVVSYK